jgi:hypothetical protein
VAADVGGYLPGGAAVGGQGGRAWFRDSRVGMGGPVVLADRPAGVALDQEHLAHVRERQAGRGGGELDRADLVPAVAVFPGAEGDGYVFPDDGVDGVDGVGWLSFAIMMNSMPRPCRNSA